MFETDGVDGGAICKRGFIHLQFAEKPEAPEAERHLGSRILELKCYIGIVGFERRQQSRVLDRTLQFLVQLCFGLRRENLEIFVDAFHASINEQLVQTYDGIFGFRLKCRVGILAFERRRQSRVLDRPLNLLVQLCCGLRRENLEIFADAIHASINEQLIQIYDGTFGFRLKCRTQMQIRDTRFGETTTQYGVGPNFTVTSSVVLLTSTRKLRNLRGCHPCKLKCYIGIVGFERRQQSRVLDRPLQLLVQLSFGLRRQNLEIFVDAFHASINEQLIQTYDGIFGFRLKCRLGILGLERRQHSTVLDRTLQLKCYIGIVGFERRQQSRVLDRTLQFLVQLCFGLRRENLEIFVDAFHASINEQLVQTYDGIFGFRLKCRVGILAFERRRQSRVLDRPLNLLVQLCCGLRRENLEIFADAIHASINEQLIQIYDGTFGFRLKCRTQMQIRDTRFGETTTQYGVGPNFTVTSSVVLLTSTRKLRNLRGCHPCKLKCYIGIVGFERRQQSRVLDRPLQLLVQLSFGLRRQNLEIFVDAFHASINEQLIQTYDGIFGFRLKCRVGILGFERRQQSTVLDRTLQLLVQMCF
ncbi:hypothetical protein V1477_006663 [Vespula maculifrons]|uniref:Uncharacterized protein n=1 Tax=Vespula maculifrons TaxID=7453 RepID=A0ABD2CJQ2_VESMC